MSRSWGVLSLITSSPSVIVPDEGDSRPATIRSVVDFPQPDGPTSTKEFPVLDVQVEFVDRDDLVAVVVEGFGRSRQ